MRIGPTRIARDQHMHRAAQRHPQTVVGFGGSEVATGAGLPQFVKYEFDAVLECGILAHGFLRLHCGDCGHDKLVAYVFVLNIYIYNYFNLDS